MISHFSEIPTMKVAWIFLLLLSYFGVFAFVTGKNVSSSSRPSVVNIGAILTSNSTIGRVAKIAMEAAIEDVNRDSRVLKGTKLTINMVDSSCKGFLGFVEALQFMETENVAVIGPQSSTIAHLISNVANELQVPMLSFAATDPTLDSLQYPFFVRMTNSDVHQMAAVADIVNYYGWRKVITIFIDDEYGRNGVAALSDSLEAKRCKISYKAGIPPSFGISHDSIMNILVQVAVMESRVIVLHTDTKSGLMVLSVAKYLGMMDNGYAWIATDWLSTMLDSYSPLPSETMDTMQGVLVLRQHIMDSERKRSFSSRWVKLTGGSLGLNSYGFYAYDTVLVLAHAIEAFFDQGGIISFYKDPQLQYVEGGGLLGESLSIFGGGKVLLDKILHTSVMGLMGPINFNSDRSLLHPAYDIINVVGTGFRRIGYWSNSSGLSVLPPETLYMKQPNHSGASQQLYSVIWPGDTSTNPRGWVFPINGKQLRIGVPIRVSFKEFVSRVRGTDVFKGFCIDVFTAAINLLPYAVPYKFIPFGDGRSNPNYTELVNMITSGEFDAAVGDIAIVTKRTETLDFTQPFAESGLVVLVPVRQLNTGFLAFLQPFSPQMWCVTGAFLLFIGAVIWILEHRVNDEFRGPPKKQIITILWFSFSTLFFSHRENTVSTLGRFVLILWLFVVLIITSSYTASLTSIYTVQHLSSPIRGIESLRASDDPIGYQVGSFAEYYLTEELGIPNYRLVPLGSPEAYVIALQNGPKKGGVAAIVDELPYVELFLTSHCKFSIEGPVFTKSGWGFAFPRDSSLTIDMSSAILTLEENGDLQRIHDKWLTTSSCSSDNTELDSSKLHLLSFQGLFFISGVACFIALMIYFLLIIRKFSLLAKESGSTVTGSSRSKHFQTFVTLIDEKKDPSRNRSKRRKTEGSLVEDENEVELGRTPKRRPTTAAKLVIR